MKIRDLVKEDPGLQYVAESMELMSTAGRRAMLDTDYLVDAAALEREWDRLDQAIAATQNGATKRQYNDLRHCLMQLHDLQGTLASLASHTTLNEVELFEIKNLAMLTGKAADAIATLGLADSLPLPDLGAVSHLLDPDHTGITNFYIYDSYDPRLAPLRRELKQLQEHGGDPQRIADLLAEQNEVQNAVCMSLSSRLCQFSNELSQAMEQMAYTDFLLSKADLAIRWQMVRPRLGNQLAYRGLFNPRLREHKESQGLRYQPIDITLSEGVTIITGANMAGKTVLLKTAGTAQLMAQCGMRVPATDAEVTMVDAVASSIGDEQNEMNGLSSYASEIIKISDIVRRARHERLLVLIDEPARTTNPIEGKALVQAIIKVMEPNPSLTLITTHYGQLGSSCRRLRVKGFVENMADVPITPQNINRFIDYSLAEDTGDDVPHEALRIATILGCDNEMIDLARKNINRQPPQS